MIIGAIALSDQLWPTDERWLVDNPIGFLPGGFFGPAFSLLWTLGLLVLAIGGATSMVVRYRRAPAGEKQQIKWLLYSVGIFVGVYSIGAVDQGFEGEGGVFHMFLPLSIMLIPVAITLAILRYRLFDIDLIVRRTLLYALLTGLLGAVYLGSVVLLQSLFRGPGQLFCQRRRLDTLDHGIVRSAATPDPNADRSSPLPKQVPGSTSDRALRLCSPERGQSPDPFREPHGSRRSHHPTSIRRAVDQGSGLNSRDPG